MNEALIWFLFAVVLLLGILGGSVGFNFRPSPGMRAVIECIDRSHIPDVSRTPRLTQNSPLPATLSRRRISTDQSSRWQQNLPC
jgi:hypothetical protein